MFAFSWPVAASDPATYREFTLGASTADMIARTATTQQDVKVLHERPALMQELSWHPPYTSTPSGRDSIAAITFSFIDNQLFKMVVDYDRSRTEGLTKEDMIASLTAMYGPRSTAPASAPPRSTFDGFDASTVVASWRQGDTSIALQQSPYGSYGLVILSIRLDALATKAQATAVTMDAREAPARDAARADAERAAAEKTRATNKAAFQP